MRIIGLISFRWFKISKKTNFKWENQTFSNDRSILQLQFNYPRIWNFIGKRGIKEFEKFDYAYCILDEEDKGSPDLNFKHFEFISMCERNALKSLSFFLWFIKDCMVVIESTIFYNVTSDYVVSLDNRDQYSKADGSNNIEEFTESELHRASIIERKYADLVKDKHFKPSDVDLLKDRNNNSVDLKWNHIPYNTNNRIERAIIFLISARCTGMTSFKIALYMPIYECLFGSDGGEIIHKVSERCAHYLGESIEEKIEIFKLVKSGYDIRSKILHGTTLKKDNQNELVNLCVKIDALTRKLLTKVIMEDSEIFIKKNLDDYFMNLIFYNNNIE